MSVEIEQSLEDMKELYISIKEQRNRFARKIVDLESDLSDIKDYSNNLYDIWLRKEEKLRLAIKILELIAQDPFNGRDGEPDPMKVILRMRVDALNALEKLK